MRDKTYQVLRVANSIIENEPLANQLFERLACCDAIDEVWIFNQGVHDILPVSSCTQFIKAASHFIDKLHSIGKKAGIDVLCTVGHHREHPEGFPSPMDWFDGDDQSSKLCTSSSKTHDYIRELYSRLAALHPDIILSDDDLDYSFCRCEKCMARFRSEYLQGIEASDDELFNSPDPEKHREIQKKWINFNRDRITEIHKTIEAAVHCVSPETQLGFMTCVEGINGCGEAEWAEALGCRTKCIVQRPGGGAWREIMPDVLSKTHKIGRQIRYLPKENAVAYSEIENFPNHSLSKSRSMVGYEVLLYIAAGCTGTAYNMLSFSDCTDLSEYEEFFRLTERIKEPADVLVKHFGSSAPEGLGMLWSAHTLAAPQGSYHETGFLQAFNELLEVGLPVAYDPDKASVFLVNRELAEGYSDEEIIRILSSGAYLDYGALEVLNQRGYGEYTGFSCGRLYKESLLERDLEHPFNLSGGARRDARPTFGFAPMPAEIVKSNNNAIYLAELIDRTGTPHGSCGGIFENSLGGRVCVWSYAPFTQCGNKKRTYQLKNIMSWLSGGKLSAYIASHHKLQVWARPEGVIMAGTNFDPIKDAKLAFKTDKTELLLSWYDGASVHTDTITKTGEENGLATFELPTLPPFSVAWVVR